MDTPRLPPATPGRRPPRWQGWILNALYGFDRRIIGDWVGLMDRHLQRRATPMATAGTPAGSHAVPVRSGEKLPLLVSRVVICSERTFGDTPGVVDSI